MSEQNNDKETQHKKLLDLAHERFKKANESWSPQKELATSLLNFVAGNQWNESVSNDSKMLALLLPQVHAFK